MPRLAIVIPCPGGPELFEDTLVSVLQHRPQSAEVLVVHSASYADPYQLAGEVRFVHLPGESSLCRLINAGVQQAQAPLVHLLGCQLTVTENWLVRALQHFCDENVAAVVPLVVSQGKPSQLISAGIEWRWGGGGDVAGRGLDIKRAGRLAPQVLGPVWNAAFYRRETWNALNGFEESLSPQAAALDFALSLRALRYDVELETECAITSQLDAEPIEARELEQLFWRHALERGWLETLVGHPWQCLRQAASQGIGKLGGRLAGALQRHHRAEQATRLARARKLLTPDPNILPFERPAPRPAGIIPRRKAA